jgi:hypothetical protein
MKKNSFLLNKYTLSVIILLVCLAADIVLHKGMSRVILPESFTAGRSPQALSPLLKPLVPGGKKWVKGVNTLERLELITGETPGFEMDVYFDTAKNYLQAYHDSTNYSPLKVETILDKYKSRKLQSSIWFDFKNLSASNEKKSLEYIAALRRKYGLEKRLIIESSYPQYLQSFADSGFYTSYYTPFFNPYELKEDALIIQIDSITNNLKKYNVSALSGYYFQYPALKKYFPRYPILTWTDNSRVSLVTNSFNRFLLKDDHVKVILFP